MRHRNVGLKLNRSSSHRNAMFRNMVTSLLKHERIRTTDVKAKEVRRWADHLITLAKRGDLHARRQAMAIVYEKDVVHKLFEEANTKFGNRQGGYTRIVKLGFRAGDAAPISMIELVYDEPAKGSAAKTRKTAGAAAPVTPVKKEAAAETVPVEALEAETAAPTEEPAVEAAETEENVVPEAQTPVVVAAEAEDQAAVAEAEEKAAVLEDEKKETE